MRTVPQRVPRTSEAQNDEAVLAYIRAGLRDAPSASATALLRRLRDSGRSCEQKRFGRLYAGIKGGGE